MRTPGCPGRGAWLGPVVCLAAAWVAGPPLAAAQDGLRHVVFESGPVRPLALSPDGRRLYAVNTPDARLEILSVEGGILRHLDSVPVGLEPVAVAARTDAEVWVVNHLSDSVSIVDVAASPPRVVSTLLVGDEPRDIVFAGPGRRRAFVTTARRGQNSPLDAEFFTPGVGRALVWVFDAEEPGGEVGGEPIAILTLFGDTPRALAAAPDGSRVYAAVFRSGNRTSVVHEMAVCDGGPQAPPCTVGGLEMPGGRPGPVANRDGVPGPETGLIVKYDPQRRAWEDELGRDWTAALRFDLPDLDLFEIDATATPPVAVGAVAGVGTTIFNLAVNPVSGVVYASNTEARNDVRLLPRLRGRFQQARITVVADGRAVPRHLNPHIDYEIVPSPPGVAERSLATPLGMAVSADGRRLYLAAFGSNRIAVLDTEALEAGRFVPRTDDAIPLRGGGPAGLVLDESSRRLFVLTRFDNSVAAIDLETRREVGRVPLHNPEDPSVIAGRRLLYDATRTSSNGEASCAGCHVFADTDHLAWDLGDPEAPVVPNPLPVRGDPPFPTDFHPLKGPMMTQTLRGLATHGSMHWRGDRSGGLDPGGDPDDARAALRQFNRAFVELLGARAPLDDATLEQFIDFVLAIQPPPNPVRALDNTLTPGQQAAREFFFEEGCHRCHVLDPAAGHFGTDGSAAVSSGVTQFMKVPHLRNLYEKVGMFALPPLTDLFGPAVLEPIGDQIRGFGFFHDGSNGRLLEDLNGGLPVAGGATLFLLAFDTNFAPVVGQQVTVSARNAARAAPRLDLFVAAARRGECDLIAHGVVAGERRGWYRSREGAFRGDRRAEPPLAEGALRSLAAAPGNVVTFTCMPPDTGVRAGIDRDADGHFDGDERDAGTDPADAASVPGGPAPTPTPRPGCPGDCDGDGSVTVAELIVGVRLALAGAGVQACPALDPEGRGTVGVAQLVAAVRAALSGCS